MSVAAKAVLVISEHIILKDPAHRERVKRQILGLKHLGPVHLIVFGVGGGDELKFLKSKLRPVGLDSLAFLLVPDIPVVRYAGILLEVARARRAVKRMVKSGRISCVHVENLFSFLPVFGSGAFKRTTVVFDYHRLIPEEIRSRKSALLRSLTYRFLKHLERRALKKCRGVVCVSEPFRDYLAGDPGFPAERIYVEPNLLDPSFFPRPESRSYYRKLYKLDDRFLIVYSGSFMPHQCPDAVAALFKGIKDRVPDACLLVLTHHQEGLKKFISDYGPFRGDMTHMRLDHDDMPGYLAMGDVGLLLRDDSIPNRVASPTKFPEYLACGLPVIISSGIGSATEVIEKTGLGVVIDIGSIGTEIEKVVDFISSCRDDASEMRRKCREKAEELFVFRDTEGLSRFYRGLEKSSETAR